MSEARRGWHAPPPRAGGVGVSYSLYQIRQFHLSGAVQTVVCARVWYTCLREYEGPHVASCSQVRFRGHRKSGLTYPRLAKFLAFKGRWHRAL